MQVKGVYNIFDYQATITTGFEGDSDIPGGKRKLYEVTDISVYSGNDNDIYPYLNQNIQNEIENKIIYDFKDVL